MLEKVKMLIENSGVGAVKKFTPHHPPKSCLQGGVKKNFSALRAPFLPLTQISPPPRSFPRSAPVWNIEPKLEHPKNNKIVGFLKCPMKIKIILVFKYLFTKLCTTFF